MHTTNLPIYIESYKKGLLQKVSTRLYEQLSYCTLCPHSCRVNRTKSETGKCFASQQVKIWRYKLHLQEEPPISGSRGSGLIFFSHCTGKCIFCQNHTFSNKNKGSQVTIEDIARIMLDLQKKGAHNINLVSPTQYLPQIAKSLLIAIPKGLQIPLIFNSSGYESINTLNLIRSFIDIFLIDAKYANNTVANDLSGFTSYNSHNITLLKEIWKTHHTNIFSENNILLKGLIIRHLVLPNNLSQTYQVLEGIASAISNKAYISLMDQYTPAQKIKGIPELNRTLLPHEFQEAYTSLISFGFENGWIQERYL